MSLNRWILAQVRRWPGGGGYRFQPTPRARGDVRNPRDPTCDGTRRALWLGGVRIARPAADGATYCCGVTLEAWLMAWRARSGLDPEVGDGAAFVAEWFCPVIGHPGVQAALTSRGLGRAVGAGEAIPGDLVQYWRSVDLAAPSGHSAVFLGWVDAPGAPRRIRYWSSQPATRGVGVHEEPVGEGWTLHFARAS